MRLKSLLTIISALTILSCDEPVDTTVANEPTAFVQENEIDNEVAEIQTLIRQMLNWAETSDDINLLPLLHDSDNNLYVGIDMDMFRATLTQFRQSGFFADEFIDNYSRIITTLDSQYKNGMIEPTDIGEMPPITFATEVDPWTLSQDVPYDNPALWGNVTIEIKTITDKQAEFVWKWGGLGVNEHEACKDFSYSARAVKENDKWKVSYLDGFHL